MERALERGSYNKEEILARLSRQLPLEEKLRVADYVIDTSGSKEARSSRCERFTNRCGV
jgi:dephospho-CoA kinase